MKRKLYISLFLFLWLPFLSNAQDSVKQRVIFIGDAGEIDKQQSDVAGEAAKKIITGKTTVIYLGDNIYPVGMGLPGSAEEAHTKDILRAQYEPMRQRGAAVYFLPGNHDWDRMGKQGLQKIKAQWAFLESQHDSLLKLLPPDGCPGPVEIPLSDKLVVIAFDSEWWVFPYDKKNKDATCDCNTKDEFIQKLQDLVYKNRYKTVFLADHHPFQSYGHHGGYYSLKDHLFPFTAINPNLYIPLPVVGSLYPLLRKLVSSPEDLRSAPYADMRHRIDSTFGTFPNLIHFAGHEHGMQFIKRGNEMQVVSGAGAKEAYVREGKYSRFGEKAPGFVVADEMMDNSVRLSYYTQNKKDTALTNAFVYIKPYVSIKQKEDSLVRATPKDSITVVAHQEYADVSRLHRKLFGDNYREEWAMPTRVPVIRISEIEGGLTPSQPGGGHQSRTLRLKDKEGKEWTLRSVNKYPQVLLPPDIRETFAANVVQDAMSAQHPYSALIVLPIAGAVGVPHSHPIIGYVAPDTAIGKYNQTFAGTVNLLEEREPLGESDNTEKMMKEMTDDNDNTFDSSVFLRARLLDVLVNDWDRHNDQWRFATSKNQYDGTLYTAVPRDRDQVFYVNEGLLPKYSTRPWLLWFMQDNKKVRNINDFFWESRFLNSRFLSGISYRNWINTTNKFVSAVTDSVLEAGLQKLPQSSYQYRHDELFTTMQKRRLAIPKQLNTYYRFLNRIVDIQTSDKNDLVSISDTAGGLLINVHKIDKKRNIDQSTFYKVYDPDITKEIRLYTEKGDDSIVINSNNKDIKIRIVGEKGNKVYNVISTGKKPIIYNKKDHVTFTGEDADRLRRRLSNDSANTAFISTDLYNKAAPLLFFAYNLDDGLVLGAGVRYLHKGFRKTPWASRQELSAAHAFSTSAFRFTYEGEWNHFAGKANLLVNASAFAPDNKQNFFGRGNDTKLYKFDGYKRFYRARFDLYNLQAALKWGGKTSIAMGPAVQYYHLDSSENKGRFILNTSQLNSYDSASLDKEKWHAGVVAKFINDYRDNPLITTSGTYTNITLQGMEGLNQYSKAFATITASVSFFKSLTSRKNIILADRAGGGITVGKTAFYQSLFLYGNHNLMGYRQYRFAGQCMFYNNFELRLRLVNLKNYVLPGQLGLMGMYDIGRVWENGEHSRKWHSGTGGGIYFAPARFAVITFAMGYSTEGWYPDVSIGFRF